MASVGFIVLRHVNSPATDIYWKHNYSMIRRYYPEAKIMLIDDNSNYEFIDKDFQDKMTNITVIQSEYPGRGELLPYYYYIRNKMFDTAVILHDSAFINKQINFTVDKYAMIWEFEHTWDNVVNETRILGYLHNSAELLDYYAKKHLWKGCFGGMSVIKHDFLLELHAKYNFDLLIPHITSREFRMCFERIIACIFQQNGSSMSLLGNIHKYCPWGINMTMMASLRYLPIIKVWSGR
jgi:hypothetical protein